MMRFLVFSIAFSILVATGGMYIMTIPGNGEDRFAKCRTTSVGGGMDMIGGPFTLVGESGDIVTEKQVIDQPALIYFGYTFCPDICPLDAVRNVEAVSMLEDRGKMVKPVFISIDPRRDTPEVMADFTENLHPRMLGLTGSEDQIKAVSKAYRTYYKRHDGDDKEHYLVDHSTFSYLAFPDHGVVEFFRRDLTPQDMADRMSCFYDIG